MLKKNVNMTEGPLLKNLIVFSVPIILSGLLQLLYNAADIIVVGRFAGSTAQAAVGSTSSLVNLIINLLTGLSLGASVLISRAYGARDFEKTDRLVHTSLSIAIVGGVLFGLAGILGARTFLSWMHSPAGVIELSALYLRIYFIGLPVNMFYLFAAAVLRAIGDSRRPLLYLSVSGLVNVLLNLLFVLVFRMDVAGVALATVLSQALSAFLVFRILQKGLDCCRLDFAKLGIDKQLFLEITRIGLPSGIQSTLFSLSNTVVQSAVNSFDALVMAGNTAANNLDSLVHTSMSGIHQGAMTFTSQNLGAGKRERLPKIYLLSVVLVTAVGASVGGLIYGFGRPILSLYNPDQEVIGYGMLRLGYIALPNFILGICDVTVGVLRGMGYSTLPMLISLSGICLFRIIWIKTVFAAAPTLHNLYIAYPISWVLTLTVQLILYLIVIRKIMRPASTD